MKFILGKKLDMTQVWQGDQVVAVTRVQAGPCTVVQSKSDDKDGYEAVQLGFGERNKKNINKPQQGHMKKLGNFRWLREFRVEGADLKPGDNITVDTFESGDKIKVTGVSKGKGFQGVVRRYGFKGQAKTHGTKDQMRMPGSAGATGPAHVFKGQKMPGRMGNDRTSIANLEVIEVDQENNILSIKGAIPGARNGLILISGEGELKIQTANDKQKDDNNVETRHASSQDTAKPDNKESEDKPVKDSKAETKEEPKDDTAETGDALSQDAVKPEDKEDTPEQIKKEVVEAKEKVDKKKADKENKG